MALDAQKKASIIAEYGKKTGGTAEQIALLTARISRLTEHLEKNKHDFSALRGVSCLIGKQKAFLKYLKRKDEKSYKELVKKLGLRSK